MSRRKAIKFRSKAARQASRKRPGPGIRQAEPDEPAKRERNFEIFAIIALLVFGTYTSALYFGHKVVPNPDFTAISRVGHELLSFRVPSVLKIAPVTGLLQAFLSNFLGGQHPDLTAGWLLNAILHPFNLILLWLLAGRIVGRAALWFALIAMLNPWVIYALTEPIAETTFLFFTLLTFYFIFRRSKWCYLFATITSLTRYEGAALILAAFVMDMIYGKDKRQRILALVYSAAAGLPLALWMLGTILTWEQGTTHYLSALFSKDYSKDFAQSVEGRTGLALHMRLLWQVGFRPLFKSIADAKAMFTSATSAQLESIKAFFTVGKTLVAISFVLGLVCGLAKRRWKILALLIFFIPYFVLHARYPYPIPRYHTNIFWIAQLICLFGLQSLWKFIDANGRVPKGITLILHALVAVVSAVWCLSLVPHMLKSSQISPQSASVPYVAMALLVVIFVVRIVIYKYMYFLRELSILALVCLIVVSSQFSLVSLVGDGQREAEFKSLAGWFIADAKPDEKLGVYMAPVVKIFAPNRAKYIVPLPEAENPSEFVRACYDQGITYVVWATREGLKDDHTSYRRLGLHKNIDLLRNPKSVGPYQFIKQVGSRKGYVNIFRLHKPKVSNNADTEG